MSWIAMKQGRWNMLKTQLENASIWTDKGDIERRMRELESEAAEMAFGKSASDIRREWEAAS